MKTSLGAFSPWLANKDEEVCVELPESRLRRQEDETSAIHLLLLLLLPLMENLRSGRGFF